MLASSRERLISFFERTNEKQAFIIHLFISTMTTRHESDFLATRVNMILGENEEEAVARIINYSPVALILSFSTAMRCQQSRRNLEKQKMGLLCWSVGGFFP